MSDVATGIEPAHTWQKTSSPSRGKRKFRMGSFASATQLRTFVQSPSANFREPLCARSHLGALTGLPVAIALLCVFTRLFTQHLCMKFTVKFPH